MNTPINHTLSVFGEALMDCIAQPDGTLRPLQGGSPYNCARACALQGASTHFLNPFSTDAFGQALKQTLHREGVRTALADTALPTSLAVVQLIDGQPSYGFYREGIADRDYTVADMVAALKAQAPGILHTGSLLLIPPEHHKTLAVLSEAKRLGWTLSVDVNLRPKLAADLGDYVRAVKEVAALADWIKASDEDLELLGHADAVRANADTLANAFPNASRIALTFGGNGAYLRVDGQTAQAAVPTVAIVDTVGAGDTFWGSTLADWVQHPTNASARVATTLTRAMQAAAINCTRAGCQPPTTAELDAALA
ncbi:MAG: PfkB family carbohydrate kinase [Burkholderiaceae bacterium]